MCALRGRGGASGEKDSWHLRLEIGERDVSNVIDTVQKDYLLLEIYEDDNTHRLLQPYGSGQSKHRRDDCPSYGEMGDDERLEDN